MSYLPTKRRDEQLCKIVPKEGRIQKQRITNTLRTSKLTFDVVAMRDSSRMIGIRDLTALRLDSSKLLLAAAALFRLEIVFLADGTSVECHYQMDVRVGKQSK